MLWLFLSYSAGRGCTGMGSPVGAAGGAPCDLGGEVLLLGVKTFRGLPGTTKTLALKPVLLVPW